MGIKYTGSWKGLILTGAYYKITNQSGSKQIGCHALVTSYASKAHSLLEVGNWELDKINVYAPYSAEESPYETIYKKLTAGLSLTGTVERED